MKELTFMILTIPKLSIFIWDNGEIIDLEIHGLKICPKVVSR